MLRINEFFGKMVRRGAENMVITEGPRGRGVLRTYANPSPFVPKAEGDDLTNVTCALLTMTVFLVLRNNSE